MAGLVSPAEDGFCPRQVRRLRQARTELKSRERVCDLGARGGRAVRRRLRWRHGGARSRHGRDGVGSAAVGLLDSRRRSRLGHLGLATALCLLATARCCVAAALRGSAGAAGHRRRAHGDARQRHSEPLAELPQASGARRGFGRRDARRLSRGGCGRAGAGARSVRPVRRPPGPGGGRGGGTVPAPPPWERSRRSRTSATRPAAAPAPVPERAPPVGPSARGHDGLVLGAEPSEDQRQRGHAGRDHQHQQQPAGGRRGPARRCPRCSCAAGRPRWLSSAAPARAYA